MEYLLGAQLAMKGTSTMKTKRGDTIVEVMFAFAIFAMVAIIGLSLMNLGIRTIQGTLELTMARQTLFTQAEAIRFIHNNYISELNIRPDNRIFTNLWEDLVINSYHVSPGSPTLNLTRIDNRCPDRDTLPNARPFVLNYRQLNPGASSISNSIIRLKGSDLYEPAALFPRILFGGQPDSNIIDVSNTNIAPGGVEGIWVIATRHHGNHDDNPFYDFHIRACWFMPGHRIPSTIGTVVRLYNPTHIRSSV